MTFRIIWSDPTEEAFNNLERSICEMLNSWLYEEDKPSTVQIFTPHAQRITRSARRRIKNYLVFSRKAYKDSNIIYMDMQDLEKIQKAEAILESVPKT